MREHIAQAGYDRTTLELDYLLAAAMLFSLKRGNVQHLDDFQAALRVAPHWILSGQFAHCPM